MLRTAAVVLVVALAAALASGSGRPGATPATPTLVRSPVQISRSAEPLSPFRRAKAEQLLRAKLPCLGCHQLDGEGGRIGPDLSDVGSRRSPDYIAAMLRDPQARRPGIAMPSVPMPPATRALVVDYLAGRGATAEVTDPPPTAPRPLPDDGPELYRRFCAACHGADGQGDGPNAAFLPVPPTVHADSVYLATRPDDSLYDAIAAGGYVMNRSQRMPPFGETLSPERIRTLVRHLRRLCRCEGPAWSRDGGVAR